MSNICIPDVARLADELGFSCAHAPALIHLRNPMELANWTLPLLEFAVVAGAVASLAIAIKQKRALGDPTRLVLWFSGIVYLLVIEPPIYFPRVFGVEHQLGIVFVHNVFTVDFMFDRLPLYIVAIYPALLTLAYDIVRALGIFARYGALIGAVCVGFVHSCFYEVFDHIGPQLKWWVWNTQNRSTTPALGAVPLTSIALFSALAPIVVALLIHRWVAEPVADGKHLGLGALAARAILVGVLATVSLGALGVPAWLLRGSPWAEAVMYWLAISAVMIIGALTVLRAWPPARREGTAYDTTYAKVFGAAFLATMAISWGSGLPDYFAAVNGVTASGTASGILPYASACFVIATLLVIAMFRLTPRHTHPVDRRDGALGVRTV
ncbi:hypothetical protein BMG05_13350 [Mycobacterium malmoense]|nr:hypothetical protein BMG05_13350 [Mycobacterium malmoense]